MSEWREGLYFDKIWDGVEGEGEGEGRREVLS